MEVKYLPLGIAMKLPKGYEAVMVSRSSTSKKLGVIQANCLAVIDNSYSGNNDQWHFPALPIRETELKAGTRICQFRVQLSQKATIWQKIKWLFNSGIEIEKVDSLDDNNRGGLGSTGQKKL
jgi:dUTP pyrophosphatase